MSTKTTFKRIALVAVASLGFGMLSAAPSSAANDFRATYSAPTAATLMTGYAAVSLGTIQVDLNATGLDGLVAADSATVTAAAITTGDGFTSEQATASTALLAKLTVNTTDGTTDFNLAGTGYNVLNNGTATASGATLRTAVAAGGSSASSRAHLMIATGLTAGTYIAKYSITSVGGDGVIGTFTTYLTVKVGVFVAGTRVFAPTTKASTITAGGTSTWTITQPYTAKADEALASAETFTLAGSVVGSTFTVTAVATGGVATIVRTNATEIKANLLKDSTAGAMSVVYTIIVSAPATATNGQTITAGTFTATVFGGQTYNGTIATPTRAKAGAGWLSGAGELFAPATAGAATVGSIVVDAQTSATPTLNPAWVFTLTGVGTFSIDGGTTKGGYAAVPAGSASTATVNFYGDGRAGQGTLTITANGNTVATQVVNYYGAATTIKVTPVYSIAQAGNGILGVEAGAIDEATAATGCGGADCTPAKKINVVAAATDNDPSLVVEVLDALGTRLPIGVGGAGNVIMTSSNTAAIASGATATFLDAGVPLATAGALVNHVTYSTTPSAKSGDKATLTFTHVNSLGATITATTDVTVGGTKTGGTVTMTLDKTSYEAGEKMVLTIKGLDAAGNKVHDLATTGSLSSNKNVIGLASGTYLNGEYVLGDEAGENLYAPSASGSFTITLASGTATGATVTVTATVADDAATTASSAAADAAAEATDAANAATDAANAAAEAADAATAAAQDAADAVAALAASVSEMVTALKKQITSLTNLVIKIQKKVKA
jgi:hypothetical protein